jgi:predicted ATPase
MSAWPATVPAVAQILSEGLELAAGVTVLTGENGSGKSTVVEVIAEACGLNPQGGSAKARYQTRESEPGIGELLWAERGLAYPSWAYFLSRSARHRATAMSHCSSQLTGNSRRLRIAIPGLKLSSLAGTASRSPGNRPSRPVNACCSSSRASWAPRQ